MMDQISAVHWRIFLFGAGAALLAVAFAGWASQRPPSDPRARFVAAASAAGITDAKRIALRDDFERTLLAMERDRCDESLRRLAGQSAVAYYETLLERPVTAANLQMTHRGLCEVRTEKPAEPLALFPLMAGRLRLPWECMPPTWRTPRDLALQARLEANVGSGLLSSETLTGTLALIARSWEDSPHKQRCTAGHTRLEPSPAKPHLPLLAAPRDSWDGRRR